MKENYYSPTTETVELDCTRSITLGSDNDLSTGGRIIETPLDDGGSGFGDKFWD